MSAAGRSAAVRKMRDDDAPDAAVRAFLHGYDQLDAGATGLVGDRELEPVTELPALDDLPEAVDADALDRTAVIKLNGGLGTSMGMRGAKSLVEAKDGRSFLELAVQQVLGLRRRHRARLPLVLMNSFSTRGDTLRALGPWGELAVDVPLDFLQHREPKLLADDLSPIAWPGDPGLEWCPPGHGDLYTALVAGGMLATLRERGYEYAFVSNSDNLGAVLEPRILEWFAARRLPFAMEAVIGTASDRKGGHLARRRADGRLVLRESSQVPEEDAASFGDVGRWRFYNTNNLWLNLAALDEVVRDAGGFVPLALIANGKTVDPADPASPAVVQLETAMGAAVAVFDGAEAIVVPRERFAPVKTTNDLLVLRSDVYAVEADARVVPTAETPFVDLDDAHFKLLGDFDARFPFGAPSLRRCRRLTVRGDVAFGRDVTVVGDVDVHHDGPGRRHVPDGALLEGHAG